MPSACPRQCSGLTTAAIFISAGIVQLIAGLILVRSRYVYLLAAPNFWTAASNVCVGCLLGLAASVWKHSRRTTAIGKSRSTLVSALLVSSVVVNATTTVILVLGEGSTLMSITAGKKAEGTETLFANEILGYAFAASVLCPIMCTAVSMVSLLCACCPKPEDSPTNFAKKGFKKGRERSHVYSWVYTPESVKSKHHFRKNLLKSSSSSGYSLKTSRDDSGCFSDLNSTFASPALKTPSDRSSVRSAVTASSELSPSVSSPNEANSFEDAPSSPVGEVVPIKVGMGQRRQPMGIPVPPPAPPSTPCRNWRAELAAENVKNSSQTAPKIPKARLKHENRLKELRENEEETSPKVVCNSFREEYETSRQQLQKEYQKVDVKRTRRKRPNIHRLKPMEAIDECPVDYYDDDSCWTATSPSDTPGYASIWDISESSSSSQDVTSATPLRDNKIYSTLQKGRGVKDPRQYDERLTNSRLAAYTGL